MTKQKINNQPTDRRLLLRLLYYVKKHYLMVIIAMVLMLLTYICSVTYPYLVKIAVDNHIQTKNLKGLSQLILLLGCLLAGGFIFDVLRAYAIEFLGQKILYRMRMDMLKKIFELTQSYFDKTPIGKTLTNLTNDLEAVREFISQGVVVIVGDTLLVLFILIAMFFTNYQLAAITCLNIVFFGIITIFFRRSIRQGFEKVRQANSIINTTLVETLNGIKEIFLYQHQKKSLMQFSKGNDQYHKAYQKIVRSYALFFPAIEVVSTLSMLLVLYAAHSLLKIQVGTGDIFAFFIYLNMFFRPLRNLAEQFNAFQSAIAASERIFKLLDTQPTFTEDKLAPYKKLTKGEIKFDNVSFHYDTHIVSESFSVNGNGQGDGQTNNQAMPKQDVLQDINLTIKSQERVAIIGSTGAGKTTLIRLLNRLYQPATGCITIDGVDLQSISLINLNDYITTIPQDNFMFTGSIAENIHLDKYDASKVIANAKLSGAHTFIKQLPNNYDTSVLEEGKALSLGQKQLLAITRAFMTKSSIIILDEATANIDSHSEELIEKSLDKLFSKKTVIIIAHRLSTLKNADRIIVMHQGKIIGNGKHQELIKSNAFYKNLYEMQSISLNEQL